MNMIVYFLLGALVCAYWFIWKQAKTIADLRIANDRAQAEIRSLEDKLREVTK